MNEVIRAEWVKRLRSGQYKKGKLRLRTPVDTMHVQGMAEPNYCCLGVLCEIAVEQGIITYDGHTYNSSDSSNNSLLPSVVVNWAGLKSESPFVVTPENESIALVSLNDNGRSFSEIADYIENAIDFS